MKRFLRIMLLSIGMLIEIAYLIVGILSVYFFGVTADDSVPMGFCIAMVVHAILAITINISGIVRAVKNCKWVLFSGFFMQVWLAWVAFSAIMFIVIPVLIPVIFMALGVFILVMCYVIAKLAKNPPKQKFILGLNNLFILSTEDSLVDAVPEYCMQFNKDESQLTEREKDLIYEYAFNWILYLLIWIIKNDYYSDSLKKELGDSLISEVKADIVLPEKLLNVTSGILTDTEVCDEIKSFLSIYAESYRNDSYWEDYLEVIRAEQSRYAYIIPKDGEYLKYCIDFSMNIYYDIADRINRSYFYFKQRNNSTAILTKE